MAAELAATKLNPESNLLLDQPLLKVPYEGARKTLKAAQRVVEREHSILLTSLKSAANEAIYLGSPASETHSPHGPHASQSRTLDIMDNMIGKMENLKRKLESLREEEKTLHKHSRKRIEHLQDLHDIPSLADVKYEKWSEIRLNRLLVDYLLRSGYGESAKALAKEKDIEQLVDVKAFMDCKRIERSLENGRTEECLAWCAENKKELKRMESDLEFELRVQQFIELVRTQAIPKLFEARSHATKYLILHHDTNYAIRAAGLLAYPPDTTIQPYTDMYSAARWQQLAALFIRTHHDLLSLPARPALHVALSAGLSALKTPACHSSYTSSRGSPQSVGNGFGLNSAGTSVCPICSTELNELARNVPYAHHAKSHVEHDAVVLPNGRIYGRERLTKLNEKMAAPPGKIRDPMDPKALFDVGDIKKVYIS